MLSMKKIVIADGLLCEVVEIDRDENGAEWYTVTPLEGFARGFCREFRKDAVTEIREVTK